MPSRFDASCYVVLVTVVATTSSRAEPPTEVPGETISVTGLRLPRPITEEPSTVIVIDREEIERSPAQLADELVRTIPSVATFRRSSSLIADPTSQGVNLRGLGPSGVSRALVLHDGIPVNDAFGGWVYWRALPLLTIERVELEPSGASDRFGNFALGGVIALVSRPIEPRQLEVLVAGGSLGTARAAARAADRFGPGGIELDGELFRSDGYTPIALDQRGPIDHAAASEHYSAGARAELVAGTSRLHGFGRFFDESLDAGTQHTTAAVRTLTYGATWSLAQDPGRLEITAFAGHQRFLQTRARVGANRTMASPASQQRTPSNNQGASVTWTSRSLDGHTLLAGVDALRVEGTSTDELSPPMIEDTTVISRSAGGAQRFVGLFLHDAWHVSSILELGAAVRLDLWENHGSTRRRVTGSGELEVDASPDRGEIQLDPRFGGLVRLSDELAIRGSVYRAFRAPTLNELHRPFQVGTILTAANPDLRPEISWGGELGAQVVVDTLFARASGFWNTLDSPITNVTLDSPLADGAMRQRRNLGRARAAGLELEATWRLAPSWSATTGYTFVNAVVTSAPGQPDLVDKRLAQDPRHRAIASIAFEDARIASITAQVRYTSRQFEDDLNTRVLGAFSVIDALASRHLARGFTVFATVHNALDRRYLVGRAGVDTIGQPRTLLVGIRFEARGRKDRE